MGFEMVAIALGDVVWLSLAFIFGFCARSTGLPPLVGFLMTGFILNSFGVVSGEMLGKLSDLGITLLLFTVGLKLNLQILAKPQVWAVTGIHTATTVLLLTAFFHLLFVIGIGGFAGLGFTQFLILAFALSFSSTVFVVKVLEEKGEMKSLHGRIAIGILIMQDLAAVIFLAFSAGKVPSPWALLLLLLIPLRPLFLFILKKLGHGELLVLYGLILSLGGAEIFELVGIKGDLGALLIGVFFAGHPRSNELATTMLGFKDLFLLGFFLSIGLSGTITSEILYIALLITPLVFLKSLLFFFLFIKFKLRSRTSLLATANLTNFSEFGLIVAAISVSDGLLGEKWLIVLALVTAISFVIAAIFNAHSHRLYARYRKFWLAWQGPNRLADDRVLDTGDATIAIIGMGRVGTGAYDKMLDSTNDPVVGIDFDPVKVEEQVESGRNVLLGDPSDADFWDRITAKHKIRLILLALPNLNMNLSVLDEIASTDFDGDIAASARYADEMETLHEAGVATVFNIYTEAGVGFAEHVQAKLSPSSQES